MSFEISELMVQLAEASEKVPAPAPCTPGSTKAPPPTCVPGSTRKPEPEICIPGSTRSQLESSVDATADLDAVRAQLRDRLAAV
jgi:hypothetical protein